MSYRRKSLQYFSRLVHMRTLTMTASKGTRGLPLKENVPDNQPVPRDMPLSENVIYLGLYQSSDVRDDKKE